jgi:hypothetical protein
LFAKLFTKFEPRRRFGAVGLSSVPQLKKLLSTMHNAFHEEIPSYNAVIRPGRIAIYKELNYGQRTQAQQDAQKYLGDYTPELAKEFNRLLTKPQIEMNYTALDVALRGIKDFQKLAAHYLTIYDRSIIDDLAKVLPAEMLQRYIEEMGQDISAKARRRINLSIDWLLALAESKTIKFICPITGQLKRTTFKINFVTLTLPSAQAIDASKYFELPKAQREYFTYSEIATKKTWISDLTVKNKLLNQFLIELRNYLKSQGEDLKFYFWRSEAQKNGNIHFHLTTDKFIPWEWQRNIWNRITNKAGFVDRYQAQQKEFFKNGFKARPELFEKWPLEKQLKAYKDGLLCDWTNPNSTDVHSVRNIKNVGAYLAKYCTKAEKYRKIDGRKWFVSTALSRVKSIVVPVEDVQSDIDRLEAAYKKEKHQRIKVLDFCVLIFTSVSDWIKYDCEKILKPYRAYTYALTAPPGTPLLL